MSERDEPCFGCGCPLPTPRWRNFSYCNQDCIDRHAEAILKRQRELITQAAKPAKAVKPAQKTVQTARKRWCAWCGDDLPADKRKFCSAECQADHAVDIEAAA